MYRTRAAIALSATLTLQSLGCGADADPTTSSTDDDAQSDEQTAAATSDGSTGVDAGGTRDATTTTASDAAASASADAASDAGTPTDAGTATTERFSFFVTSLVAMRALSKSQNGFGGDLRFGETGDGAGLRGADKICATIAETSMPGAGSKGWRAFLSTVAGGAGGGPVHAKDRIGQGPWYDRVGRLFAMGMTDLLQVRPAMADAAIKNDFPNEDGVPNHDPDGTGQVDNHDVLTGTGSSGELYRSDVRVTCNDWTKSTPQASDAPRVGHSWPRGGRGGGGGGGQDNWMSALDEAGCGAGVGIVEMGGPRESNPTVGSGGGYGAIYCFALTP